MKIFLEAFVDNNFGDNLFIHIVTARYPEYTFYMVEKEAYASSYGVLEKQISNLIVQKEEGNLLQEVDGMFVVGGDMFGNGADYGELIRCVCTVKKNGGVVAFLGISLFPEYSKKTWFDLMVLFSQADLIAVREQTTYYQLKKKFPWLSVIGTTDLAFTSNVSEISSKVQSGLLGVSVRKKVQKDETKFYPQYCKEVASQMEQYLSESQEHQVRLLAFSSGRFDDVAVARDIVSECDEKYQDRIHFSVFEGNIASYIKEIQQCEALLCTRFHAMVFAVLLEKPFIPIIYEEKMVRFLNEIGYEGTRMIYEEKWGKTSSIEWKEKKWNKKLLEEYLQKAELIFSSLDPKMNVRKKGKLFLHVLYKIKRKIYAI